MLWDAIVVLNENEHHSLQQPPRNYSRSEREYDAKDLLLRTRFPPSVLIKRNAILNCECFDESFRSTEDRDMWIRTATRYRIFYVPDKLVIYRKHGDNLSKNTQQQSNSLKKLLSKDPRGKPRGI